MLRQLLRTGGNCRCHWPSAVVLSSVFSVATIASGYATFRSSRALTTHPYLACVLAVALLAALERGVGPIAGR